MANENEMPEIPQFQIDIRGQFIKDLSFENPNFVEMMSSNQSTPDVDIKINVHHEKLPQPDTHEISLIVQTKAEKGGKPLFLLELTYSGIFTITNAPENILHPILMIECPRLLFPFVRNIISDVSRDGGYPPLMLKPVDFAELYRMQIEKMSAAPQGTA